MDEPTFYGLAVTLVAGAKSEIMVVGAVAQQVVGDDEDGMSNRHGGW